MNSDPMDPITSAQAGAIVKLLISMKLFKADPPEAMEMWIRGIVATKRTFADWSYAAEKMFMSRTTKKGDDDGGYYGLPFIADFVALMPRDVTVKWWEGRLEDGEWRAVSRTGEKARYLRGEYGNPVRGAPGVKVMKIVRGDGEVVNALVWGEEAAKELGAGK